MNTEQIIQRARREGVTLIASRNGVVQCRGLVAPDLTELVQANTSAIWAALKAEPVENRKVIDFEAERARRRPVSLRDRVRGCDRAVADESYYGPEGAA